MTIIQAAKYLQQIAFSSPYIRTAKEGSVYDIMNTKGSLKYGVFVLSQTQHRQDDIFDYFGFNAFVIDRLDDDLESNRLQIQSTAKEVLSNIVLTFKNRFYGATFEPLVFHPFTEKFVDLTAGQYCQFNIKVPRTLICEDKYEEYYDDLIPLIVTITENGIVEYKASDYKALGFSGVKLTVDVSGGTINNQSKSISITENGSSSVTYDAEYTGLEKVDIDVNVPVDDYWNSGYTSGVTDGIAEQKAKLVSTAITENGVFERVDGFNYVEVNVTGGTINNQTKSITITENGSSAVTYDAGYTGLEAVNFEVNVPDNWNEGYQSGYTVGYGEGYLSGFTDGYESGFTAGFESGKTYSNGVLNIVVTSNKLEGLLNKTIVDIKYSGETVPYVYTGNTISLETTAGVEYTLSFREIEGYDLPKDVKFIGLYRDTKTVNVYFNWIDPTKDYANEYLTFKIKEDGNIRFMNNLESEVRTIQYSKDSGLTWISVTSTIGSESSAEGGTLIPVERGDIVLFKGNNESYGAGAYYIGFERTSVRYTAEGNIMSLIYGDNFRGQKTFPTGTTYNLRSLFSINTGLTSVEHLKLPANELKPYCYAWLFNYCPSITKSPILPATTLVDRCYHKMFQSCSSLKYIKCLATNPNDVTATENWVYGVSPTGMFVRTDGIEWTRGVNGIPVGWIINDNSYLEFIVTKSGNIKWSGSNKVIEYSKDYGYTWTTITASTATTIPVVADDSVMFRGLNNSYSGSTFGGSTCEFILQGNILSLIYGDSFSANTSLPNTTHIFHRIFRNCTGLTSAENLEMPSITLKANCYSSMFEGCSALMEGPVLPAETLANNCYQDMFSECISLLKAPELPSTNLADSCYNSMFYSCTTLTTAPELPATTLAPLCYAGMFNACSSLVNPPVLPVTTLVDRCYAAMFYKCSSLTTAPELPATTLVNGCYNQMFQNCTSLNYIKCLATDISAENCTRRWTDGVANSGTFVKNVSMNDWPIDSVNGIPRYWTVENYGVKNYLRFKIKSNGNIKWYNSGTNPKVIQYTKNSGTTWTSITASTATTIPVVSGETVLFRGNNPTYFEYAGSTFAGTNCQFDVEGNIMSLIYGDDFEDKTTLTSAYTFTTLFQNCTGLTSAENLELPSTTLANNCYYVMFDGCTSLTTAPVLPATTLASGCYASMFVGCTSLTTAPVLPATTLASGCYERMFSGCTSLNYIKCLATNISANSCTYRWVDTVYGTGTFVKPSSMTSWTSGVDGIPNGWTIQNA